MNYNCSTRVLEYSSTRVPYGKQNDIVMRPYSTQNTQSTKFSTRVLSTRVRILVLRKLTQVLELHKLRITVQASRPYSNICDRTVLELFILAILLLVPL